MVRLGWRSRAVASAAIVGSGARPRLPEAILHTIARFFGSLNIWFWAIVGLPTLLAGVYYFAIASDLYVSEADFKVAGPPKSSMAGLAAMFSGGASIAADDTQVVRDFILSRDAAKMLEKKENLGTVLSRPEGDFMTRFPGVFFWRKDFEALYATYSRFVSVDISSDSGIATLRVEAYRPEDAKRLATLLLADSEELINRLNERARQDGLATFQKEVDASEQRLAEIQKELTAYRVKANMLDPKAEATGPYNLLAQLSKEEAAAKAQLADATKNAPRSPQIGLLRTRLSSLDKLISDERAKITGNGDSVATAMTEYERLNLQQEMQEKIIAQAVASREQARLDAHRQQLYLELISQPNLPDYPRLPHRVSSFATVVGTCLLAYGLAWLLIAGVREHASA